MSSSQTVDESIKSTSLSISSSQSVALQKSIVVQRSDYSALNDSKVGTAPLISRIDNSTSQMKDVEIFYLLNPRTD